MLSNSLYERSRPLTPEQRLLKAYYRLQQFARASLVRPLTCACRTIVPRKALTLVWEVSGSHNTNSCRSSQRRPRNASSICTGQLER